MGCDIRTFDMLDSPNRESIDRSVETLRMLGALSGEAPEEDITALGRFMSDLPVRPEVGRMIYKATGQLRQRHCSDDRSV